MHRARSLCVLLVAGCLVGAAACANDAPCPAEGSEFWIINTRAASLHCHAEASIDSFIVSQVAGCRVRRSSMEQFLSSSGQLHTVLYAHGHGLNESTALKFSQLLYQSLKAQSPVPFRFVLWSWPANDKSGKRRGRLVRRLTGRRDSEDRFGRGYRAHARQAEYEGYGLARVIERISPAQPICLSSHSLGSGMNIGALHLLGGGEFCGRRLRDPPPAGRFDLRAGLIAAAIDNNTLLPGRRHDRAVAASSEFLVLVNCQDRWLKLFPRTFYGVPALGRTGAANAHLLDGEKYREASTTRYVGTKHGSKTVLRSPGIARLLAGVFFAPRRSLADVDAQGAPVLP